MVYEYADGIACGDYSEIPKTFCSLYSHELILS